MRIVVVEHKPTWRLEFEVEGKRIRRALGELVVNYHHIGSTAIPSIFAKPIIDFLMEVVDIEELDEKSSIMEELGYEAKGENGIPGRRYFRKNNPSGERTHQVHAFVVDSSDIERHFVFRDYMIAHPEVDQTYSELKHGLALNSSEFRSGVEYRIDKGRIDILAVDAEGKFVVIELKLSKGRQKTVGKLLYYMSWIDENLGNGPCRGVIVAREIPQEIALTIRRTPGVLLYDL